MTGILTAGARLTALVVAGLIVAACGGNDAEPSAVAASPTPAEISATPEPETGIVLPTTSGGQFALNDVIGSPTMLWFWAPW